MNIIQSLRDFFMECPYLKEGRFNIDFLGPGPCEYTIDAVPTSPVIRQYSDGGSLRQFVFVFASREEYGLDVLQSIDNSAFYEDLQAWVEEQSARRILPELGPGRTAQGIEVLSSAYLYQGGPNTARYQIQCRLVYYQDYIF